MIQVLALLVASAQPAVRPLEIPREFWGEYNEQVAHCGTGNHDSRLRVSWDRVRFYESEAELQELIRLADGSVIVVAKHEGEGETWTGVYQLRLSADRSRLMVVHPQSHEMAQDENIRTRCPAR